MEKEGLNNMETNKLNNKQLEEIMNLYIKERNTFPWLISFEEFKKDYVVKCKHCGEYFVTDMNNTLCDDCLEHLEEESQDNDSDWQYFEDNKEHYVYGLY